LHELPDPAGFVIRQENTHGESNPAHFSVKAAAAGQVFDCLRRPNPANPPFNCRLRRLSVLFRDSRWQKLMQKIHRLTHN
jgi:hypothetical protein